MNATPTSLNNSERIDSLSAKIKAEGAKYHNYNPDDLGLVSLLKGVFRSWGDKILQSLIRGLVCFIVIMVIVKCIVSLPALYMEKAAAKVMVRVESLSPEWDNDFFKTVKLDWRTNKESSYILYKIKRGNVEVKSH